MYLCLIFYPKNMWFEPTFTINCILYCVNLNILNMNEENYEKYQKKTEKNPTA